MRRSISVGDGAGWVVDDVLSVDKRIPPPTRVIVGQKSPLQRRGRL